MLIEAIKNGVSLFIALMTIVACGFVVLVLGYEIIRLLNYINDKRSEKNGKPGI